MLLGDFADLFSNDQAVRAVMSLPVVKLSECTTSGAGVAILLVSSHRHH